MRKRRRELLQSGAAGAFLPQAVERFGCDTYRDYEDLLARNDLDLVVNSLPSHLHPPVTIEALRAGHNVVCEKPAAWSVAQLDEMIAAAKKARRLLAPFQQSRYRALFRKTLAVIDSGVLGRVVQVRIVANGFARRWDWQTLQEFKGGNLLNTGPPFVAGAVDLARENARDLGLSVTVVESAWYAGLQPQRFDLIVSNPPYIPEQDEHLVLGDVRFEPASALVSGPDGLDDLKLIVEQAPDWLVEGGWLLVEHGYDQAESVAALFRERSFSSIRGIQDYGGRDRLTLGQWLASAD